MRDSYRGKEKEKQRDTEMGQLARLYADGKYPIARKKINDVGDKENYRSDVFEQVKGNEFEYIAAEISFDSVNKEFLIQSWTCPSILLC